MTTSIAPDDEPDVVVSRGSTYDNAAYLPAHLLARYKARYEGTRTGRQELHAEVLEEVAGALWNRELLDQFRLRPPKDKPPFFQRIVVGVDPMMSNVIEEIAQMEVLKISKRTAGSETGIIAAGLGLDGHGYIVEDASLRASPLTWANKAIATFERWRADRIIGEENNGGALVEANLRTVSPTIAYKSVKASRGKITRAEPVAALYEQGKVHHVGMFPILEDQLVTYTGNPNEKSPDRLDALVWALTELMVGVNPVIVVGPVMVEGPNYWRDGHDDGGYDH